MIKLLLWGIIGYFVYRFFKIREQIKAGKQQDAIHHQPHRGPDREKTEKEGDYIDYEELK